MSSIIHLVHRDNTTKTIRDRISYNTNQIERYDSAIRDKLTSAKQRLARQRVLTQLRPIIDTLTPDQHRLISTLYAHGQNKEQISIDIRERIVDTRCHYQVLRGDIRSFIAARADLRTLIAQDEQTLATELLKPATKTRDLDIAQFKQTLRAMPHITDVNVSLTEHIFTITFTMSDYQFAIPEEEHDFLDWVLDKIHEGTDVEIESEELLSVSAAKTRFALQIDMDALKLKRCNAKTETIPGQTHRNPHFLGSNDSCCLGSFAPTVADAIKQMDFETAILVITMFAQQYTTQDSAGWGFAQRQIVYKLEDEAAYCEFLSEHSYSELWAQYHHAQDQLNRKTA